ncbi:transcription antitermination factor NusB [Moraxella bovis]|uniref:Transcription antitermination protein NusB n=1 Tax=Moraxella bovis TaxID=476 RepID=A0AAX3EWD4_MORBO|nr:transcription antitermination factor NusB [Moraxella bovis]UYZ75247.1 transcription antitermination factor NusB [Moraxella bovis]UYZ78821.1 transcription antitermination factor NusB [Moraxella bovis]UYZ87304.1 transcription antitermination factor NusB [Moraxella bovis]UYZ92730.1 transcription antitermination factor NusB [Moraxella bovis]UYZ97350.1 transcription antitermination factor NusB [Moraxella bovis]
MTTTTPPNAQNDQFDINTTGYKTSYTAIRKARRFAVQGLYEWLMTDYRFANESRDLLGGNEPHTIVAHTRADNAMHTVHLGYYHELMREIPMKAGELIVEISRYLDRSFEKLDTIEKAILLIGAYELKHSLHIPYKVVLDEAMQLNTHFGATDAHKFINAILDRYAKDMRELEYQANKAEKKSQKRK